MNNKQNCIDFGDELTLSNRKSKRGKNKDLTNICRIIAGQTINIFWSNILGLSVKGNKLRIFQLDYGYNLDLIYGEKRFGV